jgi:GT2 family glycosyltransferase
LDESLFQPEVIVVNNNPGDRKIHLIRDQYPQFRFIDNRLNGGFANGCNLGAKKAKGEFLLFLNPDTVASDEALTRLIDTAKQHPDCAVLSCQQVDKAGRVSKVSGSFPQLGNLTGWQRALLKRKKNRREIYLAIMQSIHRRSSMPIGSLVQSC